MRRSLICSALGVAMSVGCTQRRHSGVFNGEEPALGARSASRDRIIERLWSTISEIRTYQDEGTRSFTLVDSANEHERVQCEPCVSVVAPGRGFKFQIGSFLHCFDGRVLTVEDLSDGRFARRADVDWAAATDEPVLLNSASMDPFLPVLMVVPQPRRAFDKMFRDCRLERRESIDDEICWVLRARAALAILPPERVVFVPCILWLRCADSLPRRLWIDLTPLDVEMSAGNPGDGVEEARETRRCELAYVTYDFRNIRLNEELSATAFDANLPDSGREEADLLKAAAGSPKKQ